MNNIKNIEHDISILYVENDEDIRDGYVKALKRFCTKLYIANNGKVGLELYKEYSPDIVISDINMPIMNGIDMVKAIREIDAEKCHVIFTTTYSDSKYLLDAISLGVDGYLIKPVEKNLLKEKILKASNIIIQEKRNIMQQSILQNILDAQKNPLFVTDFKEVLFANKIFLQTYNSIDVDEFNLKCHSLLHMFLPMPNYLHQGMIKQGETFYDLVDSTDEDKRTVTLIGSDGKPKAYNISISKVKYYEDDCYLLNLTDITKRNLEKIDTEKKAYFDGLTGIYNRTKLNELFEYELSRVKRYKNISSIVILDIDHFKKFNDTHGHLVGDEVLQLLVEVIGKSIRKTDIFARWGGEEFVILLTETKVEDAKNVANQLKNIISSTHHKIAGQVTASFGVTQIAFSDTIETAFKRCDDALYIAKENGRNRVEVVLEDEPIEVC